MNTSRFSVILWVLISCGAQADPPVLSAPRRSGTHYTFTLEGEFNAGYVIEHSTNLVDWRAVSTNWNSPATRDIEYEDLWHKTHFFRTYRLREFLFSQAILARDYVDFSHATGVTVDSFDSGDPRYSTNGRYDPIKQNDNGHVSAVSGFTNSIILGNAKIMGRTSTSIGGGVSVGPSGSVGSKAWVEGGNLGIQPGWAFQNAEWHPILVVAPYTNAPSPRGGTVDGVPYTFLLEGGNFLLPNLDLSTTNDRMRVTSDSVLFVLGDVFLIGSGAVEIDRGVTLKLYVGRFCTLRCDAIENPGSPANFQYYGLPENTDMRIIPSQQGTNSFVGTIYAPNAYLMLNAGSGWDLCSFSGSIVASYVVAYGPCRIHFDEHLLRDGPQR